MSSFFLDLYSINQNIVFEIIIHCMSFTSFRTELNQSITYGLMNQSESN